MGKPQVLFMAPPCWDAPLVLTSLAFVHGNNKCKVRTVWDEAIDPWKSPHGVQVAQPWSAGRAWSTANSRLEPSIQGLETAAPCTSCGFPLPGVEDHGAGCYEGRCAALRADASDDPFPIGGRPGWGSQHQHGQLVIPISISNLND